MKYGVLLFLLSILPAVRSLGENGIMRIPLTYVLDWDFINKLPVRVSFDHSNVFSTSPTSKLNLLNYNLSVSVKPFPEHQDADQV